MEPATFKPLSVFSPAYHRIKCIGAGSEGRADLYHSPITNAHVVAKLIRRPRISLDDCIYWPPELKMLLVVSPFKHPNIISYFGYELNAPEPGTDAIFLEYCESGDLEEFKMGFMRDKQAVPEAFVWKVFSDIASALVFLHTGHMTGSSSSSFPSPTPEKEKWTSILHRDIKPSNILLSCEGARLTAKLADLGATAFMIGTGYESFEGGTPDYAPPEAPFSTHAADVWGLGASIHFLCLGEPPVDALTSVIKDQYEDLDDVEWRRRLPRRALHINTPPGERTSQWEFLGSAEEEWEGVYSGKLDGILHAALRTDWERRMGVSELFGMLEKGRRERDGIGILGLI